MKTRGYVLVIGSNSKDSAALTEAMRYFSYKVISVKSCFEALLALSNLNANIFIAIFLSLNESPIDYINSSKWLKKNSPNSLLVALSDDAKNASQQSRTALNINLCLKAEPSPSEIKTALKTAARLNQRRMRDENKHVI